VVSWTRVAATAALLAMTTALVAQSNAFQFVIAVSDGAGNPIIEIQELKLHDLVSKERCRSMACRSAQDRRKRVSQY
jgi:hypothetical protein